VAGKLDGDIEELVSKARNDAPAAERRYVYSPSSAGSQPGYAVRPNKRAVGRRISTFYLIVVLFGVGVASVGYINNIIVVNRLSGEINRLQVEYDRIANVNATLKAEVDGKSGRARIVKLAGEQAGLREPKEPPRLFGVDEDAMERERSTTDGT
jgi:hypothetical protein